jgi:DNA polymerase-4
MLDGNWSKIIMHIDMDAFFAAIEQAHLPQLKGKPVIIGGSPEGRGVVSTCSYEARRYGIHSAMSAAKAVRQCPDGIFIGISAHKYTHISLDVLKILSQFSPIVEPVSIDEAFVDITSTAHRYTSLEELAKQIKRQIWDSHKLTASIGISAVRIVAKMASSFNKPDGLTIIEPGRETEFLWPQPIRNLWGVGPKAEESFHKLGIFTIGDLSKYSKPKLKKYMGIATESLIDMANGKGESEIHPGYEDTTEKSMGHEHTFDRDETNPARLEAMLLYQADKVARRLRLANYRGRTVTLKLRLANFARKTRSESLATPTDCEMTIYETARTLFHRSGFAGTPIRLIGVSASNLEKNRDQTQLGFLEEPLVRQKSLDNLIDKLRDKYGERAIGRAGGYGG